MHYGLIRNCDSANGPGIRISLFVSGCTNRCEGCFQPETWNFNYGKEYSTHVEDAIMNALRPKYIKGLTILGGEPFEPENQRTLVDLVKRVRAELPEKDIWCYTGFTMDKDLIPGGRKYCEVTDELLQNIDVIVDGRFELENKDISLRFRGSTNQRIINVPETLERGQVVLSELNK